MKVCIVGAGAIGGYLAVMLGSSGHEVTAIARGAHLAAIQKHGLRLIYGDGRELTATLRATDQFVAAGRHELVIVALKAHQLPQVASELPKLFDADTIVLTLQNGLPWWYFHGLAGPYGGRVLQSVDPEGCISSQIDVNRVIHSVVYPATEVVAPGIIQHHEGNRFPLGELDGRLTDRVQHLSQVFTAAGLKAPVLTDTRGEVWLKLLGNVTFNPLSALAHATVIEMCQYPLTRELIEAMMLEARMVAESIGVDIRLSIERRIAGAEKLGSHKMSMLQDVEAGRQLEIDALVGAVAELGELTGTPTPCIKALYACAKLLDLTMQRSRAAVVLHPV